LKSQESRVDQQAINVSIITGKKKVIKDKAPEKL
jgi:hypothetical protein